MYRPCYAPVFRARNAVDCALQSIRDAMLLLVLIILLAVTFGSPGILCMIRQTQYRMRHCREGNADPAIDIGFSVGAWVSAEPAVRDAIVWRTGDGTARGYSTWTREEKAELAAVYQRLVDSGDAGLPMTPAVDFTYHADQDAFDERERAILTVGLNQAAAWQMFLAYVAQSLRTEITRAVPWSIRTAPPGELELLFDSRSLFHGVAGDRYLIYGSGNSYSHGRVTPGDPGRSFAFVLSTELIGDTSLQTVERTVDWCRGMTHHSKICRSEDDCDLRTTNTRDANDAHWGYEGFAPVERVISGTVRRNTTVAKHWTAGCWGTTGFLRAVLRTVNIPVRLEIGCGHALPHFVHERRFLSHGDDPYNSWSKQEPRIAAGDMLLDIGLLEGWFGPGNNCDADRGPVPIGRGVAQAIKDNPPYELLRRYCRDESAGLGHGGGEVFEALSHHYALAELEADGLWDRLESRVAELGGCDSIPNE